jgi:hypothetical protein
MHCASLRKGRGRETKQEGASERWEKKEVEKRKGVRG